MLYTTIDNSSFVTRAKSNLDAPRVYLHARDRSTGVICDQSVALKGSHSNRHCPMPQLHTLPQILSVTVEDRMHANHQNLFAAKSRKA